MEFLDIYLTEDSFGFLTKTRLYCGFKNTNKIKSILGIAFLEKKNEGRKPDKNSSLRRLKFMPRNLD
jgi:hypothetical protein